MKSLMDSFERRVTYHIGYHELDVLLNEHFQSANSNTPLDNELMNDSTFSIRVDGVKGRRTEEFKRGLSDVGKQEALMNELERQGLIEKGTYIVDICW
jgi:hypothetical protein